MISAMSKYHNGAGSLNDIDLKPDDTAIVYVCELPDIKGKFDPAKAAVLDLKPGPKYCELQLGNSVQPDSLTKWLVLYRLVYS
jgi:ribonuclease Z